MGCWSVFLKLLRIMDWDFDDFSGFLLVDQNPAASIGLYVDCGSNYETPVSIGATDLLRRMAFKSTRNRSHLRVVREVEAIGGNVEASSYKEQMSYTYNALKTYVPEMVELLIDSVRNSVFLDWEVNEEVIFLPCICQQCLYCVEYIRIYWLKSTFCSFGGWKLRLVKLLTTLKICFWMQFILLVILVLWRIQL